MKLFRFLTTTAITTMAVAAMAVSASAADITASYSYDSANSVGTVALTGLPESATTQLTLLVLSENATSITEANKGIIKQIDQGTNSEIAAVKVADLSPDAANQTLLNTYNEALATYEASDKGDDAFAAIEAAWNTLDASWKAESAPYYVRVGGTQDSNDQYIILADDFTVPTTLTKPSQPVKEDQGGSEEPEEPSPIEGYYKGDANMDDWVDGNDAREVLKYGVGLPSTLDDLWDDTSAGEEEKYILELVDTNEDNWIDGIDATEILKFGVGLPSEVDKYYEDIEF